MDQASDKRKVPSIMKKILAVDAYLTDEFVKKGERILALRQIQVHGKALEISCHGIPWLAGWLAFIWIINEKNLYQMQVNFFIGLILDIVLIAITKSFIRRRRPTETNTMMELGPDKYSFPSGHASRSAFIVYFFINIWPLHFIFFPPLVAWSTSVCLSRLLKRKHYLLDVAAGVVMGILLGIFLPFIYLSQDTSTNLIYWLMDEKLDGGEYHV